ncbi:GIY-YIG nuclease family protein [Kitasatospora sp. RG8]|uniref:GIY-YIG nuclease family protein n=1 Tax=Kitasatospora sp. RG8 TaxID=2820815 RepID=UPI001AE02794|nr:GIY-YIG nuclease family protein [Kitasatospora sp. RG8]
MSEPSAEVHSWVYVIASGVGGPVKIGCTSDMKRRLSALQCGSPVRLTVLATFPGPLDLERALHRLLSEYRVAGEWFDLPGGDPVRVVADVIKQIETGSLPAQRNARVARVFTASICSCGHRAGSHGYHSLSVGGQLMTCGTDHPYSTTNAAWPCRCLGYDGAGGESAVPKRESYDLPPSRYSVSDKLADGSWGPDRPLYEDPAGL